MRRFFLAHKKSENDIAGLVRAVEGLLAGKPTFQITAGRDFFDQEFKRAGSWDAWTSLVAEGIDPVSREPLFHGILVPWEAGIGAGTAAIVTKALRARKPVFAFMDGERGGNRGKFRRVSGIDQRDPKDWQGGHCLVLEG